MIWHSSTAEEVIKELNTDKANGLTSEEAEARLKVYKKNEIHNFNKVGFINLLFSELKNYLYLILVAVSVIYMVLTSLTDNLDILGGVLIILLVFLNAWVNAFGKYRSVAELDMLRTSITSKATVIRDGKEMTILSNLLVPGDIILLKTGDFAPADGRLIDSYVLKCDEYTLTGEDVPIDKFHDAVYEDITPMKNRNNMIYSGCSILNGHAVAVVTETGVSTEIGRAECIANEANSAVSPLKTKVDTIAKYFAIISFVASALIFFIGVAVNFSRTDISFANIVLQKLIVALSVAVAAIPEAVSVILTFSLALGVKRLFKNKVTVSNLQITENIRNITTICTDKTGVLTTNQMSVKKVYNSSFVTDLETDTPDDSVITILRLALICSNFKSEEHIERHANSLENAIEKACIKHTNMSQQDMDGIYPRLAELPFDSMRRMMTTVSIINGKPFAITKGAAESIAERCLNCDTEKIKNIATEFALDSLKVIAVAMKPLSEIPANPSSEELESKLTFVGLIGIDDPLDPESVAAFKECEENGIKVIMVTGDHIDTAKAVAKKIGILKDDNLAITGEELAELSDEELAQNISKYTVFARLKPEDKLRIVTALKENGEKVLVTGDSVNDTPALLSADIGCALGATGSDVVRTSSDIVVRNNKFSSIMLALMESRRIFINIRKGIQYLISCNFAEILALVLGLLIFKVEPISAAAILWINFITDGFPALALASNGDISSLSLDRSSNVLFNLKSYVKILVPSVTISVLILIAYAIGNAQSYSLAITMAFAVTGICEIFHAFSINSGKSLFKFKFSANKTMLKFCGFSLAILLLLLLTPIGKILSLTLMPFTSWLFVIASALIVLAADEITKLAIIKFIK